MTLLKVTLTAILHSIPLIMTMYDMAQTHSFPIGLYTEQIYKNPVPY